MNTKLFFKAMNEVDDKYYEEAANYQRKSYRWVKFTSLAACAAVVLAVSLAPHWRQLPKQALLRPGVNPQTTSNTNGSDKAKGAVKINVNESGAPDAVISNIDLRGDDYTSMTYGELLTYFDISLPVTDALPYLVLKNNGFGIYRRENRDVYFDGNTVVFESADGTRRMSIGLAKVYKHTYDIFTLAEDELKFTNINGRDLAVFRYTNEAGADCYYTEFLQNDVAFMAGSENISAGDYANCLQTLIEKAGQNTGPVHTITGKITSIDSYARHIGIVLTDDEAPQYSRGYGIDLPDEMSADGYSLGDVLKVTYTGEPATICTVWAQQLVDIELIP